MKKVLFINGHLNAGGVERIVDGFDVSPYPLSFKMLYWSIQYQSVALRRLVEMLSTVRNLVRK